MLPGVIRIVAAALALSALLASCTTGTTAQPPAAPDPAVTARVITDQIVNWPAGHLGRLSVAEYPDGTAASAITLASATVDGQGRFSLTLPGGDQLAPYMNRYQITPRDGCTTHFTSSVPTATHYTLSRYALEDTTAGKVLSYRFAQNNPDFTGTVKPGDYFIERVYAEQAHTVTGTLDCPTFRSTLNVNLQPGWNAVVRTVKTVGADGAPFDTTLETRTTLPPSVF